MTWNYRMTVQTIETGDGPEEIWTVREVYYDKDGNVESWTKNGVAAQGDSREALIQDQALMNQAFFKPAWDIDKKEWRDQTWPQLPPRFGKQ